MIDTGQVKNQTELARINGISRARITQIMNLLKLPNNILKAMVQIGYPLSKRMIPERYLQKIMKESKEDQGN